MALRLRRRTPATCCAATTPTGSVQSWTWDELGPAAHRHRPHRRHHDVRVRGRPSHAGRGSIGPDGSIGDRRARRRRPTRRGSPTPTVSCTRARAGIATASSRRVTDAIGATISFEFDAAGLLVRLVDAAGVATHASTTSTAAWCAASAATRCRRTCTPPAGRITRRDRARRRALVGHVRTARRDGDDHRRARLDGRVTSTTCSATSPPSSPPTARRTATSSTRSAASISASDPTGRHAAQGLRRRRPPRRVHRSRRSRDAPRASTCSAAPIDRSRPTARSPRWTYHPNGEMATVTGPDGRTWATDDRRSSAGSSPSSIRPVAVPPAPTAPPVDSCRGPAPPGAPNASSTTPPAAASRSSGSTASVATCTLDERGQITGIDTSVADGADDQAQTRRGRPSRDGLGRAPPHGRLPHRAAARPGSNVIRRAACSGRRSIPPASRPSSTGTSVACCVRPPTPPVAPAPTPTTSAAACRPDDARRPHHHAGRTTSPACRRPHRPGRRHHRRRARRACGIVTGIRRGVTTAGTAPSTRSAERSSARALDGTVLGCVHLRPRRPHDRRRWPR